MVRGSFAYALDDLGFCLQLLDQFGGRWRPSTPASRTGGSVTFKTLVRGRYVDAGGRTSRRLDRLLLWPS